MPLPLWPFYPKNIWKTKRSKVFPHRHVKLIPKKRLRSKQREFCNASNDCRSSRWYIPITFSIKVSFFFAMRNEWLNSLRTLVYAFKGECDYGLTCSNHFFAIRFTPCCNVSWGSCCIWAWLGFYDPHCNIKACVWIGRLTFRSLPNDLGLDAQLSAISDIDVTHL